MPADVTLCILAGGESRRMGRPKAELRIDSVPILADLLDRLRWTGPTLLVTAPARPHPPGHERFDREVCDPVPGEGPLRGVMTALENISTARALILSIDMPLIDRRQIDWLLNTPNSFGAMGRRRIGEGTQIEPFPSLFARQAIELVRSHLAAGRRSIIGLCDDPRVAAIDVPTDWPTLAWTNLNTPRDVNDLAKHLPGRAIGFPDA